jgi:hypothetical protein
MRSLHWRRLHWRARNLIALGATAGLLAAMMVMAPIANADAPDPILSSVTGTVAVQPNGNVRLSLTGKWQWTTHTSDCNANRAGVGYAVAWTDATEPGYFVANDPNTGQPVNVGDSKVGGRNTIDQVVHPTPNTKYGFFKDVTAPSQYTSWRGGCGTFDSTKGFNSGTWGALAKVPGTPATCGTDPYCDPTTGDIFHDYPPNTTTFQVCVITYDVHGKNTNNQPPSGSAEIISGGTNHNSDNGLQQNAKTPLGNGCFVHAFPSISTSATSGLPTDKIQDTATLAGATGTAGGTITFTAYSNSTCATAVFSNQKPVSGNGSYTSDPISTPVAEGTYYWIASYSGDTNNGPAAGKCGDSGETSVVAKAHPALVTSATSGKPLDAIQDTATLSGATGTAGGSITFTAWLNNSSCTGSADFTSTPVSVSGNGPYTSPAIPTPVAEGTWYWIATYGGDANNSSVSGQCGDMTNGNVEQSTVGKAKPDGSSAQVVLPNDTFTLTGGDNPSGTVTFSLFPPTDPTCSGTPSYTEPVGVNGDGTYSTSNATFTLNQAGQWNWLITYGGDANNAGVTLACGAEFLNYNI